MQVVTPSEMNKVDELMAEKYCLPTNVLMENAANAVATYVFENVPVDQRILIVTGSGNNGGDGWAAARLLFCRGYSVKVLSSADESRMKDAVKANYELAKSFGINHTLAFGIDELKNEITYSDVIIDAVLGTGITGFVNNYVSDVINTINQSKKPVISVDVPSGVDASSGKICGVAVKADVLIVLGAMKEGLLFYPARKYYDKCIVDPISIPEKVYSECSGKKEVLTDTEVRARLITRPDNAHKGCFGRLGIIAGSVGMTGAACLSADAALRSGAGLISLAVPASLNDIFEKKLTEQMTVPIPENDKQALVASKELYDFCDAKTALIIGPGLGKNAEGAKFIPEILKITDAPVIIDADGLNLIQDNKDCLKRGNIVITPHLGEMSRLTKRSIEDISEHQKEVAVAFASEYNVTVVLKSDVTVIASPEGKVVFNITGNSGMATGGSGDVLSGIVGSLLAQGYKPYDAAVVGAYINGRAADIASEKTGTVSLAPTDTVNAISSVFTEL